VSALCIGDGFEDGFFVLNGGFAEEDLEAISVLEACLEEAEVVFGHGVKEEFSGGGVLLDFEGQVLSGEGLEGCAEFVVRGIGFGLFGGRSCVW